MEKITAHIRPIDWTEGDVYGMDFILSGINPSVQINWGDGKSETFHGNEIRARHTYPKGPLMLFVVEAHITADRIDFANPTGGDCDYELMDFSQAPSIIEIMAQRTKRVIIDNPILEILNLTISLGKEYDFSKCPCLKDLTFSAESKEIKALDLSKCHKFETFSCCGYLGPDVQRITFANDAPLKMVDITGHNLHPSCVEAIHRLIERNGGILIGEFENRTIDETT